MNVIILWNTIYTDAALEQLAREGYTIRGGRRGASLAAGLRAHQFTGRYAFSVPDFVTRGQLRPLRNPADALEDVA